MRTTLSVKTIRRAVMKAFQRMARGADAKRAYDATVRFYRAGGVKV